MLLNGGGFEAPQWSMRVSWRTCPTKPMRTSDAASGRLRAVIGRLRSVKGGAADMSRVSDLPGGEPDGRAGRDASLAGAVPGPLPGARAVPGDRRGLLDRQLQGRGVQPWPVTGALFAGLFVGQFAHVPVSGMTKSFLFLLFLFGIGYSVGPQFMQALKRDGLKPVLLAVVLLASRYCRNPCCQSAAAGSGFAAGLMSGALTQSAAMGTATDAVNGLPCRSGPRTLCCAHRRGGCGLLHLRLCRRDLFCTVVAPALLRIDLRAEALKLEQALGMSRAKPGLASGWRKFELRAYRLPDGSLWPD